MKINWGFIQERFDWLGHIVEYICIALVVAAITAGLTALLPLVFGPAVPFTWGFYALLGSAFAAGHFHGREKRDCEVRLRMVPPHLKAYDFRLWSWDELTDFFPVLAVFAATVFIFAVLLL